MKKKIQNFIFKILENDFFNKFYVLNYFFNKKIKLQNRDYKSIPIFIISYNQLITLEKLINFLLLNKYKNVVILDNNSSYQPLLNYLDKIKNKVKIYRFKENYGHKVFWINDEIYNEYKNGYFALTDADILPLNECPEDFILEFKKILDKNLKVKKVGFSLKIDDIPDTFFQKKLVVKWENQFWLVRDKNGNYISEIDTTFALYRPENFLNKRSNFFKAIRTKAPYIARHGGWYIDSQNLNAEQTYYFNHSNHSNTWKLKDENTGESNMYTKFNEG
jgi:hypothetical protein